MSTAFAPSNIALIKYWGKRDAQLNLPNTDSLSISLGEKGTTTTVEFAQTQDHYLLNNQPLDPESGFAKRLKTFLDLHRPTGVFYHVSTVNNIPTAAGLASSASGFAALSMALNDLHQWNLSLTQLSVLARMGSGSACRSLWHGFVKWQQGKRSDGLDSHGIPLNINWPELRIGLLILSSQEKSLSSREAMQRTIDTSKKYQNWPLQVHDDLVQLEWALDTQDFELLGKIAESNALAMHATMEDAHPPVHYSSADTLAARGVIWKCRKDGIPVYFTQDAGPNLKLLFLEEDQANIITRFPSIDVIDPKTEIQKN
jgi:diphosphomevalonate decarboxylase